MKWTSAVILLIIACLAVSPCFAKGGFSSSRGGFRSGGYSSRSYTPRSTTTITRNTVINRSYGGGYGGYHPYYYHPMMYPGFGMGYGYSSGMFDGLIIGNLMHPQGTTVYSGGGYAGNALLYPDGRVVDQNGYQVGTYQNGAFSAVQNGGMVAQAVPSDFRPPAPSAFVVRQGLSGWAIVGWILVAFLVPLIILELLNLMGWMPPWGSVSETVTETVVSRDEEPIIVGKLKRKRDGAQYYVIDPVDKTKNWLNDKDDMYEDADRKIWRLVG